MAPLSEPSSSSSIINLELLGYISTVCFALQYVPQILLNFSRKSVAGFSTTGILIKLIGAAFLWVNSALQGESLFVVLYGASNVVQHTIFMTQFSYYTKQKKFLFYCLIPIIPLFLGYYFPVTMTLTSSLKPISQILSHVPQLMLSIRAKSSEGCSLFTQHLNILGGILGMIVLIFGSDEASGGHGGHGGHSFATYLVYFNSILQAVSIYAVVVYFDGWGKLYNSIYEINQFFGKSPNPTPISSALDGSVKNENTSNSISVSISTTAAGNVPIITIGEKNKSLEYLEMKRKDRKNAEPGEEEYYIQTPEKNDE